MRTNTIPSAIRIIGHPFCFLREIPIATNNIPNSIDAIIAKNPILFTPFKMDYSIMAIGYFQIIKSPFPDTAGKDFLCGPSCLPAVCAGLETAL